MQLIRSTIFLSTALMGIVLIQPTLGAPVIQAGPVTYDFSKGEDHLRSNSLQTNLIGVELDRGWGYGAGTGGWGSGAGAGWRVQVPIANMDIGGGVGVTGGGTTGLP